MVTLLGIVLTTIYLGQYTLGILLFLIPVIYPLTPVTDGVDGFLADYYNEHSKWGKIVDPFRDRYFTFVALGNIFMIGGKIILLPLLMTLGFELLIWVGGLILYAVGDVPNVHCIGKVRAAVHWAVGYIVIIQYYWIGTFYIPILWLMWIMAIASIAAYVFYVYRYAMKNIEHISA